MHILLVPLGGAEPVVSAKDAAPPSLGTVFGNDDGGDEEEVAGVEDEEDAAGVKDIAVPAGPMLGAAIVKVAPLASGTWATMN